ncbi:hypothetical protein K435DRAFT_716797 [Dendrothele bispora CBS 962.96]|uniref:Uncharacterized protein n=1 Tax=Dendrothele bispora (strain CBS 962.96) TaxID=1314807 RepID=A0A4S8MKB0_DENBC|nr:hypothetical protein K435DRAFT_716797 [Dendrothele bispora CBS 962.96]
MFRRAAQNATRTRFFSASATSRKDLVQDLYLKELKVYKPAPVAKDAHVGVVKNFSSPSAPKPPTLPSDMATELNAYDASEPTLASTDAAKAAPTEGVSGADAFLEFLEQDLPKPEAHHH